jgi:hypothetical protein
VTLIHEHARGIPRTISVICDNALVNGMALGRQPVDRAIVLEVCRDFRLQTENPAMLDAIPPVTEVAAVSSTIGEHEAPPAEAAAGMRPRRFSLFGRS